MNPEQNAQEQEVHLPERKVSSFNSVTPLSKYLAMILFISMPFLGGWIGYMYSPVKVVEVERVIVREVETLNQDLVQQGGVEVERVGEIVGGVGESNATYTNPSGKFSFEYPKGWSFREEINSDEWVSVTPMNPLPNATEIADLSITVKSFDNFYSSAVDHSYLIPDFDNSRNCSPVTIDGIDSMKCVSSVVNGITYIVPLFGSASTTEALYIFDSILNSTSSIIVNSVKVQIN